MKHAFSAMLATSAFLAGTALGILPAAAVKETDEAKNGASAMTPPSVIVFNQRAEGQKVKITYAHLPHDGYVAIYAAGADGKPEGNVLGFRPLPKGDHRDVTVEVEKPLKSGMTLWTSLYHDVDGDQKLDKKVDQSYWPEVPPLENRFDVL